MRRIPFILSMAAVGLAMLVLVPAAHALSNRTWVSGVGEDANPCSRTAPCKTFTGALAKTEPGGLINVLDPGAYGTVDITKSVTIDGSGGGFAGILATDNTGVIVNGAGIKVILRNLSIEGIGTGVYGISFIQGAQLSVENCRIFGFHAGDGMAIRVVLGDAAQLMVKDTDITDNGFGIHLETSDGQLQATLDHVRIEGMLNHGLETVGPGQIFVTVKDSTISHNTLDGVRAGGAQSVVNLDSNMLAFNNGTSVNAAVAGARIRISNNTIVNNTFGLKIASGASIDSARNNRIAGYTSSTNPNGVFIDR